MNNTLLPRDARPLLPRLHGHYVLGNGYRAYNPILMRFNSPDSWSPFGRGGLNAYVYCLDDPVNRQDPSGHFSLGWVFQFLGRGANTLAFAAARSVASGASMLGGRIAGGFSHGWQMFRPGRQAGSALPVGAGQQPYPMLQQLPDVPLREIVHRLQGDDLVNLSRTSHGVKNRVDNNVRTFLPEARSQSDVDALRGIALGKVKGYLPSRVAREPHLRSTTRRVIEWSDTNFAREKQFVRDAQAHDLKLQRMDSPFWSLWWRRYYRVTQAFSRSGY